jgi:cell wall-associated NlpC family hydrolase
VVIKTKVLTTVVALLTALFVTLPATQGQANAKEVQEISKPNSGVLGAAKQYLGTPYCRGGQSPRCFDCSGFVKYVHAQKGIDLPRTSAQQYKATKKISKSEAIPGDLVFFHYQSGYIHHVGIYVGDGKVLHSPKRGQDVRISDIWTGRVTFGRV